MSNTSGFDIFDNFIRVELDPTGNAVVTACSRCNATIVDGEVTVCQDDPDMCPNELTPPGIDLDGISELMFDEEPTYRSIHDAESDRGD